MSEQDLGEHLMKRFCVCICAMTLGVIASNVSLTRPADAQIVQQYFPTDLPGYKSDITLPMPDYDPRVSRGQGIRIGALDLDASASETPGYDSAPLGSFGGASASLVTGANLDLRSDWTRDAIGAQIGVEDYRYKSSPIANHTNWNAAAGGSLDVGEGRINAGYDHIMQNLAPTELGVLGVGAPVSYSDDDERLNAKLPFGRVELTPAFEHQQFNFGNLTTPIPLQYSSNDHDNWSGSLTGLYELSKGLSIVAMIRGSTALYVSNGTALRNNYDDVIGFVGVNLQANATFEVRALIGAENRSFRYLPLQSATIPTAELNLTWQPNRLTDVLLWFSRGFQDATFPFASSEVTTSGRVEVERALQRNIELRAFVGVGSSKFGGGNTGLTGQNATTNQLLTTIGVEAEWKVNRYTKLNLVYNHRINDFGGQLSVFATSFNPVRSYSEDGVTLGITLSR